MADADADACALVEVHVLRVLFTGVDFFYSEVAWIFSTGRPRALQTPQHIGRHLHIRCFELLFLHVSAIIGWRKGFESELRIA